MLVLWCRAQPNLTLHNLEINLHLFNSQDKFWCVLEEALCVIRVIVLNLDVCNARKRRIAINN